MLKCLRSRAQSDSLRDAGDFRRQAKWRGETAESPNQLSAGGDWISRAHSVDRLISVASIRKEWSGLLRSKSDRGICTPDTAWGIPCVRAVRCCTECAPSLARSLAPRQD